MNYNVCMFAYNEERNIERSMMSVLENAGECLNVFYILANGCTDETVNIANRVINECNTKKVKIITLDVGDKCNAWNFYVNNLSGEADVHFFVDADVEFSEDSFQILANKLTNLQTSYVAIAGLPLSGRNKILYESLVKNKSCIFGNFYGVRGSFIKKIKCEGFRLPKGLCWIDSFITKALNTDLKFLDHNLNERISYVDGVGYKFRSLSFFVLNDVKTYFNRIARYELGKIQEKYLDKLSYKNWPENMDSINAQIKNEFNNNVKGLSLIKKILVRKRLFK